MPWNCLIQFWDIGKNWAFFFHHVLCNVILFTQTFSLTRRRKETIISYTRWKTEKTVISANEIQWIRPLKRCSEQDNFVWLISDFDSETCRKTNAPLFLEGEKAIRSASMSSPLSDTAVLNNNYIFLILRESFLSSSHSLWLFISHTLMEDLFQFLLWEQPCQ